MRVVLILTVAAMMAAALLAWAEQPRERRDCATCPVLIEVPAGAFLRQDRLGGPTLVVRFERPYAIGKYAVTRAEFEAFVQPPAIRLAAARCGEASAVVRICRRTGARRGLRKRQTHRWCA